MTKCINEINWLDDFLVFSYYYKKIPLNRNFWNDAQVISKKLNGWKDLEKMKNPEKNAVAKLGYTVTMVVVTTAILICMKKYKDK